jgi:Flp pilus assembly protein TadD
MTEAYRGQQNESRHSARKHFRALANEADEQRRAHGYAGLGDLAITEGKPEEAIRHLRRALELAPREPQYHYLLGFAYGQMKRWQRAAASLTMAADLKTGSAEYLRCLGWVFCNSGQVERGRGLLLEAREIEPRNPYILTDLAASCLDTKEFELARRYAAEARSLAPGDPLVQSLGAVTEQNAPENW